MRLSWSHGREAYFPQDRVYSLRDILGVHIPVDYDESEERTFLRLQNEIIRTCDNQSIFAWQWPTNSTFDGTFDESSGLLAKSLDCFANCSNTHPVPQKGLAGSPKHTPSTDADSQGNSLTDTKVVTVPLRWLKDDYYEAHLACARGNITWDHNSYVTNPTDLVRICLQKSGDLYQRVNDDQAGVMNLTGTDNMVLQEIVVLRSQSERVFCSSPAALETETETKLVSSSPENSLSRYRDIHMRRTGWYKLEHCDRGLTV